MKLPVVHIPFLPYDGMALFPFILIKRKVYRTNYILINHEKIHLRQQAELLLVFFYLFYILNYIFNLFIYRNHQKAYLNIVFEKEAYAEEAKRDYLERRPLFEWLKYLWINTKLK